MFQLRRFALAYFHSHGDATGVFSQCIPGNCRIEAFRQPCYTHCILSRLRRCRLNGTLITTDREQGMLDLVMHNVLLFVLVNPPLSACERRSCCSRLSEWLHTGSIQFDKSGRKRQWRRYANGTTLEQNATISTNKYPPRVNKFSRKRMLGLLLRTYVHTHTGKCTHAHTHA